MRAPSLPSSGMITVVSVAVLSGSCSGHWWTNNMYFCVLSLGVRRLSHGCSCLGCVLVGVNQEYNFFLVKFPRFPTLFGASEIASDGVLHILKRCRVPMAGSRIYHELTLFVSG